MTHFSDQHTDSQLGRFILEAQGEQLGMNVIDDASNFREARLVAEGEEVGMPEGTPHRRRHPTRRLRIPRTQNTQMRLQQRTQLGGAHCLEGLELIREEQRILLHLPRLPLHWLETCHTATHRILAIALCHGGHNIVDASIPLITMREGVIVTMHFLGRIEQDKHEGKDRGRFAP